METKNRSASLPTINRRVSRRPYLRKKLALNRNGRIILAKLIEKYHTITKESYRDLEGSIALHSYREAIYDVADIVGENWKPIEKALKGYIPSPYERA